MKLVIATDGSEYSFAAAKELCRLFGERKDLEIRVVSVYEEEYAIAAEPFAISPDLYKEIAEASENQARKNCETTEEFLKKELAEVNAQIESAVLKGSPEREIVEFAKSWGADLIVVGSHGRGFWGRLLGSVSDGVTHHSTCSVLVVKTSAE
ncbi:MAG TPA: universal stress protein [Pyrinomonadaceae bacterium]|jgi:nucleotide-binding universal stress UspA family protein|nr:universal stress protein [Pyrinomonadaceae bacterium]